MRASFDPSAAQRPIRRPAGRQVTGREWTVEFDTGQGFSATWEVRCDLAAAWRKARRVSQALGWHVVTVH